MRQLISCALIITCLAVTAADQNRYIEIFDITRQKYGLPVGDDIIHDTNLTTSQIISEFRKVGLTITSTQIQELKNAEIIYDSLSNPTAADIQSAFPYLTQAQAQLFLETDGDLAIIAAALGYNLDLGELLIAQAEASLAPTAPSSPVNKTVKLTLNSIMNNQRAPRIRTSGDWFDNLYAQFDYNYSSYEDTSDNNSGRSHTKNLSFGGELFQNTDLSFTIGHTDLRQRGVSDLISETYIYQFSLHHRINENYGFGAFGFFTDSDLEEIDAHIESIGSGLFFTTYHNIGDILEVSTVNSLTFINTENLEDDYVYIGLLRLSRSITDTVNFGVFAYYTDSLAAQSYDTSYWNTGLDLSCQITDSVNLYLSYENTLSLTDYREETFSVSLRYLF